MSRSRSLARISTILKPCFEHNMLNDSRLPVTVLSGFLGAGKTTGALHMRSEDVSPEAEAVRMMRAELEQGALITVDPL